MPSTITLPELTALWLQDSLGVFTQETLDNYRTLLENHVFPFFGNKVEITEQEAKAFITAKDAQGLSQTTVNRLYNLLLRILDYGASAGFCPAPNWNINLATAQPKHETVILSFEEENRLLRYLTDKPDTKHLGLFLALTLGLTTGEIQDLKWKDVSFNLNRIRVLTENGHLLNKRKKKRDIPFGEREKIYLRKLASQPDFFITSGGAKPGSFMLSVLSP